MKSYLLKWVAALVLTFLFLWLSFGTQFLPKEVYPLLAILLIGLVAYASKVK